MSAVKAKARKYLLRNRGILIEAKDKPCTDCGVKYPSYVMDMDHVLGDKVDVLSKMVWYASEKDLLSEIAKCEVVCANCHRVRTFTRIATSIL